MSEATTHALRMESNDSCIFILISIRRTGGLVLGAMRSSATSLPFGGLVGLGRGLESCISCWTASARSRLRSAGFCLGCSAVVSEAQRSASAYFAAQQGAG